MSTLVSFLLLSLLTTCNKLTTIRESLWEQRLGLYICVFIILRIQISNSLIVCTWSAGEVGPWSPWSPCSVSCGKGESTRTRTVAGENVDTEKYPLNQTTECYQDPCPDGRCSFELVKVVLSFPIKWYAKQIF